jgi:hypothetical protein
MNADIQPLTPAEDAAIAALVQRIQRIIDDAVAARKTTTVQILEAIKARGAA